MADVGAGDGGHGEGVLTLARLLHVDDGAVSCRSNHENGAVELFPYVQTGGDNILGLLRTEDLVRADGSWSN
jgi:hypothetical protein